MCDKLVFSLPNMRGFVIRKLGGLEDKMRCQIRWGGNGAWL